MNKKISQFEVTTSFENNDILTLVQDNTNKIIHKDDFETSLSSTFATNERVDGIEEDVANLDTKVDNNYADLSTKIVEGDTNVTNNLSSNINSYYDVLNNKIITLEDKHDKDLTEVNDTVQGWIDEIDDKSTKDQLQDLINRLTEDENIITALADLIANGGGSGEAPGFHTQPTSTIFPLSGYYKGENADPLATTDTLNQALAKLECQIDNISTSSSGSLPLIKIGQTTATSDGTIYTSGKVDEDYLRNSGDTATGYTTFLAGIQGGKTFRSGWDGEGASLWPVGTKWHLEVDDLFVRGNLTVNELIVNEIKAVGGDILVTMADMEIVEVVDGSDGWTCYFDDEDGTKYNQFRVRDQAICQKFDGKNVKRYWRMVSDVGNNYIVLSKSVCEPGSANPEVGDKVLLLGHRVEADPELNSAMNDRRNAIFISAKGEGSPRIAFYDNIDDFTLAGKDRTVIGKESKFVGTLMQTTETGDVVRVPIYRGEWNADTTYNYYDQVTYQGSLWIAMKDGVTSVPGPDNDEWQLQVSKGDSGKPGDDVAKWVEITGTRLFLYDSPDYSGVPTPSSVVLYCNSYGLTNPTYEWRLLSEPIEIIGNNVSTEIPYTMFTTRTANVRCVVTDSDGSQYYDDVQIAKLANGAEGLDAYYIDLTNSTVNIPYDSSGNTPLVGLDTIYTEAYAYHGVTPIEITNIASTVVSGEATVAVYLNKITLASISTVSATIRLSFTLADGVVLTKDWYVNKTHDGESGFDGVDAAYAMLTGEQVFKYASDATVPVPSSITLSANAYNIEAPTCKWYWSIPGTGDWQLLENETGSSLVVSPNGSYFTGNDEVTFKCEVTSINGGVSYTDMLTINKLYDGANGESVYRGALSNEAHTVAANFNGAVDSTELAKATADAKLWYGTNQVTNNDYTITTTLVSGNGTLNLDNANKRITATSITTDTMVWRVHFMVGDKEVDVCDFTVTKAKGGAIGNQQISIYCMTTATPNRPLLTTRPSSYGTSSNGYTWYPDPTYSTSYATWESKGTLDPNQDGVIIVDESTGYRWTTPVRISGKDGEQGPQGPVGPSGSKGKDGDPGLDGPGLNYRGEWTSGKSYGWSSGSAGNVRDVVKDGSYYYMWNSYYRGSVPTATSSNRPSNSYTTVDGTSERYWTRFGASFESIATGLLLAETATIAGWEFANEYIYSQSNTMRLDGRTSPLSGIHLAAGSNAASSPGSAPFRIATDGSFTATKATITGTVTANAGKIGNYEISNGWLKTTQSGGGSAGYFSISNNSTRIRFGDDLVPSVAGGAHTLTAEIYNANNGESDPFYKTSNTALLLTAAGNATRKVALQTDGFIRNHGGISLITANFTDGGNSPASAGHSKTFPYSLIAYQNEFVFQPTANTGFNLPTPDQISTAFGQYPGTMGGSVLDSYIYSMTLTNIRWASGALYVRGVSGAPLINQSGNIHNAGDYTYGQQVLNAGCSARVTYFNRNWYITGGWGT